MNTTKKTIGALVSVFVVALLGITLAAAGGEVGKSAPEISSQLTNSKPLNLAELKGKVALVEFWTFGCYNCRNVEPYVKVWHEKYADKGLTVIAVHSPEFSQWSGLRLKMFKTTSASTRSSTPW